MQMIGAKKEGEVYTIITETDEIHPVTGKRNIVEQSGNCDFHKKLYEKYQREKEKQ